MPAVAAPLSWHTARRAVRLDRPVIAGIVNVTPDSFWDGGRHASVEAAVRFSATLLEHGADMLDVGGESTRPGAAAVPEHEELQRVVPVVAELARRWPDVPLSVDTVKAAVAQAALDAGAAIINDVSGLRAEARLGEVVAGARAGLVLMHSRGTVTDMASYAHAAFGPDPVGEVLGELGQAVARADAAGVARDAIVLDPGLGFGKRTSHSLALLRDLDRLASLGLPILVGPSRKRFLGEAAGGLDADDRLEPGIAACVIALMNGARIFRVHDVAPVRRALDLASAVLLSGEDA